MPANSSYQMEQNYPRYDPNIPSGIPFCGEFPDEIAN